MTKSVAGSVGGSRLGESTGSVSRSPPDLLVHGERECEKPLLGPMILNNAGFLGGKTVVEELQESSISFGSPTNGSDGSQPNAPVKESWAGSQSQGSECTIATILRNRA